MLYLSTVGASTGNEKLRKTRDAWGKSYGKTVHIASFNLPAIRSCPGSTATCRKLCYADDGRFRMPGPRDVRLHNHLMIKRMIGLSNPVPALANAIYGTLRLWIDRKMRSHESGGNGDLSFLIRIHDSGDFFHRDYCRAWGEAWDALSQDAQTNSVELRGYAYTKSLHFLSSLESLFGSENFSMIQSEETRWNYLIDWDKPTAKIFATGEDALSSGYVNGWKDDTAAIKGERRIGLSYHGTKSIASARETLECGGARLVEVA